MEGDLTAHRIEHYVNGVFQWAVYEYFGVVTSSSGEVFTIKEMEKYAGPQKKFSETAWWHINLKGDRGPHYIAIMKYDLNYENITIIKAMCK